VAWATTTSACSNRTEYRNASDVFLGALHVAPATDEHWQRVQQSYELGRTLGAFAG